MRQHFQQIGRGVLEMDFQRVRIRRDGAQRRSRQMPGIDRLGILDDVGKIGIGGGDLGIENAAARRTGNRPRSPARRRTIARRAA